MKKIYTGFLFLVLILFGVGCSKTNSDYNELEEIIKKQAQIQEKMETQEEIIEKQKNELQKTIVEQEKTLTELNEQFEALRTALEGRIADLEETVSEQKDLLQTQQAVLENILLLQGVLLENLNKEYTGKITALQDEIAQIKSDLAATIESEKEALEAQLESLELELTRIEQEHADKIDSIWNDFEIQKNKLEEKIQILTQKLEGLENNLIQQRETLESQEKLLQVQAKEIKVLKIELEVISHSQIMFHQEEETLHGVLDIQIAGYPNEVQYLQTKARLEHPLTREEAIKWEKDYNYKFFNETFTNVSSQYNLMVSFHGFYELYVEVSWKLQDTEYTTVMKSPIMYTAEHYNLAWLHATMPTLLFASDLFGGNAEGVTYIELERAKTYDFSRLPENALKFPLVASASEGNYDQTQIPDFFHKVSYDNKNTMIKWMEELYAINPDSKFKVFGVDNALSVVSSAIISKVPMKSLTFRIYTDGSYTTRMINDNFSDVASFKTIEQKFEKWLIHNLTETKKDTWLRSEYILAASKMKNFEYVVNNTSSWIVHQDLQKIIKNELNVRVVSVGDAFAKVSTAGKLPDLEYLLRTRWGDLPEESMSSYFAGTPSKNLLILGTSPTAEENVNLPTFEHSLNKILELYGSEYKIFYKGHPRYPSDGARVQLFEDSSIRELPNSIPVETLMLLYENVFVGGYSSTSFQSSLEDQTLFFFGSKAFISGNASLKEMIEAGIIFKNTKYFATNETREVVIQ